MLRQALTIAAIGFAVVGSARAQTAAENRDADALAADMRVLAANPIDIEALIVAGELTLKMGDNTAAAGFFGRAERLDPFNPRIKAGWGSLMLRAERPGEALRRFQDAAARGLDPRKFAADRGLAYDLVGEQDRAQRDYRLALLAGADDEVTRRYAVSLGISGHKQQAFKLLDPLLRRSDRAAWRDRAFILAMSGDVEGAQKIAMTMMSPGLGAGLAPFFQRLPQLGPADRAFAVTFGELRPSPERLADARLVPSLPKLAPDPNAPRDELALAAPVKSIAADDGRKRKKRRKDDLAPVVPAVAAPAEVALAPPAYVPPPVYVAPRPAPIPAPVYTPPAKVAAAPPPPPPVKVVVAPKPVPAPVKVAVAPKPAPTPAPARAPVVLAAASPPKPPETTIAATPVTPPPSGPVIATDPVPGVADQPSAGEAGVSNSTATAKVSEDTVIAKIVMDLGARGETASAPAPAPRPAPVEPKAEAPKPAPAPVPVVKPAEPKPLKTKIVKSETPTDAKGKPVKGGDVADAKPAKGAKAGTAPLDPKDGKTRTGKPKEDVVALDRNGCPLPPAKGASKGKSTAAKPKTPVVVAKGKGKSSLDARCKAAEAKEAKDAKAEAATKSESARVWVQVAGGANQAALDKAWAGLKAKAPDLFRGRQGWSTPLRNTNRVLTGPFKSEDEAQDFVNRMSKAGLSGFVFNSAKGQKIERLGSK
ncbi:MAG: SPOR domain-containing protein [Pseudomonadota bacterium]